MRRRGGRYGPSFLLHQCNEKRGRRRWEKKETHPCFIFRFQPPLYLVRCVKALVGMYNTPAVS